MNTEIYKDKIQVVLGATEKEAGERKPKVFLICPVRGHNPAETEELVHFLENEIGLKIHWPHRDTNQNDLTGLHICEENRAAIEAADIVLMVWDGKSTGSLFDLGITFALRKPLIPLELPEPSEGKSFQNMITAWYQNLVNLSYK